MAAVKFFFLFSVSLSFSLYLSVYVCVCLFFHHFLWLDRELFRLEKSWKEHNNANRIALFIHFAFNYKDLCLLATYCPFLPTVNIDAMSLLFFSRQPFVSFALRLFVVSYILWDVRLSLAVCLWTSNMLLVTRWTYYIMCQTEFSFTLGRCIGKLFWF